jgi:predicted O-methyltransferase YrrM
MWSPVDFLDLVRSVDHPHDPTSIFPSELAYFLYECDRANIGCIVESGRRTGYSTAVLATYGVRRNVRIISADVEPDPAVAATCRQRLSRYPNLELLNGNSFLVLPQRLRDATARIALLIDGPKNHRAIYLSAASCAIGPIALVAQHNVGDSGKVFDHFRHRFPFPGRLEQSAVKSSPAFAGFRAWERVVTAGGYRDLEHTTLVVSSLTTAGPDISFLRGRTLSQTVNARLVYHWWNLGAPAIWGLPWLFRTVPQLRRHVRLRSRFRDAVKNRTALGKG